MADGSPGDKAVRVWGGCCAAGSFASPVLVFTCAHTLGQGSHFSSPLWAAVQQPEALTHTLPAAVLCCAGCTMCFACRYDEVLEVYRRNLYSLRRLILTGDNQQRNWVMHMFIQQWVDQQVARFIDPQQGPAAWTRESLDAAAALAPAGAAGSLLGSSREQGGGGSGGSHHQQQQGGKVSPLSALIWHIHRLVNPPELVNKMQVEFRMLVDGVAYDSTAQTLLQLGQQQSGGEGQPAGAGGQQQQQQRVATVPVQVSELQVLSQEQIQQLAAYLMQGKPLPWPQPRFEVSFKTQLAFAAHARLFGTPAAASLGAVAASSSEQQPGQQQEPLRLPEEWCLPRGVLATQRPAVKGRHAAKVGSSERQTAVCLLGASLLPVLPLLLLCQPSDLCGHLLHATCMHCRERPLLQKTLLAYTYGAQLLSCSGVCAAQLPWHRPHPRLRAAAPDPEEAAGGAVCCWWQQRHAGPGC